MKYDVSLTLRTENDTYAKQSFSMWVRDADSREAVMHELKCIVDSLPDRIKANNKNTLECVFNDYK